MIYSKYKSLHTERQKYLYLIEPYTTRQENQTISKNASDPVGVSPILAEIASLKDLFVSTVS